MMHVCDYLKTIIKNSIIIIIPKKSHKIRKYNKKTKMKSSTYFIIFLIYSFLNDLKALDLMNPFTYIFDFNKDVGHTLLTFSQISSQLWSFLVSLYVTIFAYKLPVCNFLNQAF